MERRKIFVVPHTHWDREWYLSFQSYRIKLVNALDDLVAIMSKDLDYSHFMIDGQMAAVDDYLEIRGENEVSLKNLAVSNRLSLGPWYILMDEFLTSGETIIRNLQLGISRASSFGKYMKIGYLPDMFGHIAQMPQILHLAGIQRAVVWRGVPHNINRHRFFWKSPDGTSIETEYLYNGYGNGAAIPDNPNGLLAYFENELKVADRFFDKDEPFLFLNGTDHQPPKQYLAKVINEANSSQDKYEFLIASLEDYFEASPHTQNLPVHEGELRSSARANLLMGVISNNLELKRLAVLAENSLEKLAEPLACFVLGSSRWADKFLDLSWKYLILNSAHDSSCACSIDDVIDNVSVRYKDSLAISTGVINFALEQFSNSIDFTGTIVLNMGQYERAALVEIFPEELSDQKDMPIIQKFEPSTSNPTLPGSLGMKAKDVKLALSQINSTSLDEHTHVVSVTITKIDDSYLISVVTDVKPNFLFSLENVKKSIFETLENEEEAPVNVRFVSLKKEGALGYVKHIGGYSYKPLVIESPKHLIDAKKDSSGNIVLTSEDYEIIFNSADGSFSINGIDGYNSLEDTGDEGDTYNYSPPVFDELIKTPNKVELILKEVGPLRATVEVLREYIIPESIDSSQSKRIGISNLLVKSEIELRCTDPIIRITTEYHNLARDHRLRALFPLIEPTDHSEAGCAFATVTRPIEVAQGTSEIGIPTFPSRHFIKAGKLTILHEGLPEYELIKSAKLSDKEKCDVLALTLLRATGMLSRFTTKLRPLPAGPALATTKSQMLGHFKFRYAIVATEINPYLATELFFEPVLSLQTYGKGTMPKEGVFLKVKGAQVSAIRKAGGFLELRVFNPTPDETVFTCDRKGYVVNLLGEKIADFNGSMTIGSFAIVTLWLNY